MSATRGRFFGPEARAKAAISAAGLCFLFAVQGVNDEGSVFEGGEEGVRWRRGGRQSGCRGGGGAVAKLCGTGRIAALRRSFQFGLMKADCST
jgi:hypothetical protein